jgi:hypothetical protein
MKKLTFIFTFLLVLLMSVSCEEQIAEELKSVNNTESASNSVGGPNTGFRVTNKMIDGFSHFLHKEGDKSAACEVVAPVGGWDADDYTKSGDFAVDCVLEIEEYDMHRYGAELEFSVDNGLCEYVSYTPHRFFQYQPGATIRKEYEVGCDDICSIVNESACNTVSESNYLDFSGASTLPASGIISFSGNSQTSVFSNRTSGSPNRCEFDYTTSGGPNCDAGDITTYKYNIESYPGPWCDGGDVNLRSRGTETDCIEAGLWVPESCADGVSTTEAACLAVPAAWTDAECAGYPGRGESDCTLAGTWQLRDCQVSSGSVAIVQDVSARVEDSCGGDTLNCAEGPGAAIQEGKEFTGTVWTNEDLSPINEEVTIESPYSLGHSTNRYMASYSRVCANTEIKSIPSNYVGTEFRGHEVEELASFTKYFGASVDSDNNGSDDYIVYAEHGYKGAASDGGRPRNWNKPYYSFNCLDKSRDVKAQLRVHIRDWDREFTTDSAYLTEVSDIKVSAASLMDNSGMYDGDQEWNDYKDWDDFWEKGSCTNSIYTIEQECTDNGGTWNGIPVFTTSDCRELENKPDAGTCYLYFSDDHTLAAGIAQPAYTNKADCINNVPRCSLDFGGPPTITNKNNCVTSDNGFGDNGVWIGTPWQSNDNSFLNFINSAL